MGRRGRSQSNGQHKQAAHNSFQGMHRRRLYRLALGLSLAPRAPQEASAIDADHDPSVDGLILGDRRTGDVTVRQLRTRIAERDRLQAVRRQLAGDQQPHDVARPRRRQFPV